MAGHTDSLIQHLVKFTHIGEVHEIIRDNHYLRPRFRLLSNGNEVFSSVSEFDANVAKSIVDSLFIAYGRGREDGRSQMATEVLAFTDMWPEDSEPELMELLEFPNG